MYPPVQNNFAFFLLALSFRGSKFSLGSPSLLCLWVMGYCMAAAPWPLLVFSRLARLGTAPTQKSGFSKSLLWFLFNRSTALEKEAARVATMADGCCRLRRSCVTAEHKHLLAQLWLWQQKFGNHRLELRLLGRAKLMNPWQHTKKTVTETSAALSFLLRTSTPLV